MSRLDAPRAVTQLVDRQPSAVERAASALAGRLADYLELTKPRIVVLELIVAGAVACLATRHDVNVAVVLHALGATALVAGSASIGNQVIERRSDARMRRTANRPLPAGRIATLEAVALSAAALAIGAWWLAAKVPAKLFIINENGDYFWVDWSQWRIIAHFALFRAGLTGAGAVPTLARLLFFPFTFAYLLSFAGWVHLKRRLRTAFAR